MTLIVLFILSLILYKVILRVLFGMVIVPEDKLGLVTKKFVLFGPHKSPPDGKIIATKGEPGFQARTLALGLYWGYVDLAVPYRNASFTIIPEGKDRAYFLPMTGKRYLPLHIGEEGRQR